MWAKLYLYSCLFSFYSDFSLYYYFLATDLVYLYNLTILISLMSLKILIILVTRPALVFLAKSDADYALCIELSLQWWSSKFQIHPQSGIMEIVAIKTSQKKNPKK